MVVLFLPRPPRWSKVDYLKDLSVGRYWQRVGNFEACEIPEYRWLWTIDFRSIQVFYLLLLQVARGRHQCHDFTNLPSLLLPFERRNRNGHDAPVQLHLECHALASRLRPSNHRSKWWIDVRWPPQRLLDRSSQRMRKRLWRYAYMCPGNRPRLRRRKSISSDESYRKRGLVQV